MYKRLKDILLEAMDWSDYMNSEPGRKMSGITKAYKKAARRDKLKAALIKDKVPQKKDRQVKRFERDMDRRAKTAENDKSTHLDQWES